MNELLGHLEALLRTKAPELLEDLHPPADDRTIDKAQQDLGYALPTDVVELYRWHDGQEDEHDGLFLGQTFLSLDETIEVWDDWGSDDDCEREIQIASRRIAPRWWSKKWLPIASSLEGNLWCVDLGPAAAGVYGQVIRVMHDEESRTVVGDAIRDILEQIVSALASGDWNEENGWQQHDPG
jgi:cell wall assembly regulator SMI1